MKKFKCTDSRQAIWYHLKKYHSVEEQLKCGIEVWWYRKNDKAAFDRCCDWLYAMGYLKKATDETSYEKEDVNDTSFEDDLVFLPSKRSR